MPQTIRLGGKHTSSRGSTAPPHLCGASNFMSKQRLEALSDGVIAIAITLLILEIDVPEGAGEDLPHQLAEQWPSYVSYVVSFFVIGVIWLNHHALLAHLGRADRKLMALNLVLLFTIE